VGAGLLAALFLVVGGLYLYLRSALPQTAGRIVLSGPRAEIRIERDADGDARTAVLRLVDEADVRHLADLHAAELDRRALHEAVH